MDTTFGPFTADCRRMLAQVERLTVAQRRALAAATKSQPKFLGGPSFMALAQAEGRTRAQQSDALLKAANLAVVTNNDRYATELGIGTGRRGDWLELSEKDTELLFRSDTGIYRAIFAIGLRDLVEPATYRVALVPWHAVLGDPTVPTH